MNNCPNCGGTILGDGYTTALHCEFVIPPLDKEPDAPISLCNFNTLKDK